MIKEFLLSGKDREYLPTCFTYSLKRTEAENVSDVTSLIALKGRSYLPSQKY
jgi:hypothetical protein